MVTGYILVVSFRGDTLNLLLNVFIKKESVLQNHSL